MGAVANNGSLGVYSVEGDTKMRNEGDTKMRKELVRCVVSRKLALAALIRNVAGHDWGWFSEEDQRMHLQTVDVKSRGGHDQVKVWLETRGKRTFQIAKGTLSGPDIKKLKAKVEEKRGHLEILWIHLMVNQDWLKAELRGSVITLTAYPDSHNRFERTIDLRERFPGAYKGDGTWLEIPPIVDFDKSLGMLRVGHAKNPDERNHLEVSDIVFRD